MLMPESFRRRSESIEREGNWVDSGVRRNDETVLDLALNRAEQSLHHLLHLFLGLCILIGRHRFPKLLLLNLRPHHRLPVH